MVAFLSSPRILMYNRAADPYELLNVAGRRHRSRLVRTDGDRPLREVGVGLRERLIAWMIKRGQKLAPIGPVGSCLWPVPAARGSEAYDDFPAPDA